MIDKLYEYFKNIIDDNVTLDNNTLTIWLDSDYGSIELKCNFTENLYVVSGIVDEYQYSSLFLVDEEDINELALSKWNTTDIYSNLDRALKRCQEILNIYESESGGCNVFDLDDPEIFDNAVKLIEVTK